MTKPAGAGGGKTGCHTSVSIALPHQVLPILPEEKATVHDMQRQRRLSSTVQSTSRLQSLTGRHFGSAAWSLSTTSSSGIGPNLEAASGSTSWEDSA